MPRRVGPKINDPSELVVDPRKLTGLLNDVFEAPKLDKGSGEEDGYVEGWRTWKVSRQLPLYGASVKLQSATFGDFFWTPRVKSRAECDRCDQEDPETGELSGVPGEACGCGFYSAKSLEHLREMGYIGACTNDEYTSVVGKLANWGKVIEGSQGWRAEYAYPVELYLPFDAMRLGPALKKSYGVPVRLMNVLTDEAP
jgi:hypothetical protein